MNRKQGVRSRAHNFRFYGIIQTYETLNDSSGRLLDDFYNQSIGAFAKSAVMAKEQVGLTEKRLTVQYNLQTRWTDKIKIGDRVLFIESNRLNYDRSHLLLINTYRDKTGRKEYLDLRCTDGAYCAQAGVQPPSDNLLIFKVKGLGVTPAALIQTFADFTGSFSDYIMQNLSSGRPDLVMVGDGYKNNFMIKPDESDRPTLITPNTITAVKGTINNTEYNFEQTAIPGFPLFIYQAPADLPIDRNKTELILLVFTS